MAGFGENWPKKFTKFTELKMPKIIKVPGRKAPWRVIIPPSAPGGRRVVRFFKSRDDALLFSSSIGGLRGGALDELAQLPEAVRSRLLRCLVTAGGMDHLEAAVAGWVAQRAKLEKPLAEAVEECIDGKDTAGRSPEYVHNLKIALGQFVKGRERRLCSSITSNEIEDWLAARADWEPATKITYLRRLETFFYWAVKRGYSASNPAGVVEEPTDDQKPIVALSPLDCRRLLETCRLVDLDLLPYFAIALFAGLRPEEIKRLEPENIKAGWIEVQAHKAKTRRRRLVEIHPTLAKWLEVGGSIGGWSNWRERWQAVRLATAVGPWGPVAPVPWVSDVLRHSFASYAYPIKGAQWTSNECGHSESVLFQKYRALVTEEQAREFWAICP